MKKIESQQTEKGASLPSSNGSGSGDGDCGEQEEQLRESGTLGNGRTADAEKDSRSIPGVNTPSFGKRKSPSGDFVLKQASIPSGELKEDVNEKVNEMSQLSQQPRISPPLPAESNDEVPSGRKAETIPLGGEDQFAGQVSHACRGATSLQPDEDTYVAISFHEESVLPKLHGGKAAELEQDLEADGYKRPSPVCRANLWCHEEYIDTCVDSGATLSLLSSKVYKRVEHTGCVTPIRPTKDILTGVSGKRLKMEGVTLLTFSFDGHICQAPVMVGELHGVDLLLGMDWLSHNDAHIDFSRMLLRFRKDVVVPLRTTRNVFSRAHSVRFHTRDDSTNGMQYVYSDCVDGFVRVRYDQEILAGHAQQLSCYVTGPCEKKTTALFTPKLNLGPGVEVVESLVEPVHAHHGAWTIQVAVLNRTGENLMVEQHVQLGRLQAVDQHPTSVGNVHKKNSGYAVWDIAHQTLRQSANYLFGDGDCVVQTDLVNAEFRLAAAEEK